MALPPPLVVDVELLVALSILLLLASPTSGICCCCCCSCCSCCCCICDAILTFPPVTGLPVVLVAVVVIAVAERFRTLTFASVCNTRSRSPVMPMSRSTSSSCCNTWSTASKIPVSSLSPVDGATGTGARSNTAVNAPLIIQNKS